MKLDYLHDLTKGGKHKQVISENLIRLYDFTIQENRRLVEMIKNTVLKGKATLALHEVEFIESISCRLTLLVAKTDMGIVETDKDDEFECVLTTKAYENMISLMAGAEKGGHHWLCDTSDNNIDFLFSRGGEW